MQKLTQIAILETWGSRLHDFGVLWAPLRHIWRPAEFQIIFERTLLSKWRYSYYSWAKVLTYWCFSFTSEANMKAIVVQAGLFAHREFFLACFTLFPKKHEAFYSLSGLCKWVNSLFWKRKPNCFRSLFWSYPVHTYTGSHLPSCKGILYQI